MLHLGLTVRIRTTFLKKLYNSSELQWWENEATWAPKWLQLSVFHQGFSIWLVHGVILWFVMYSSSTHCMAVPHYTPASGFYPFVNTKIHSYSTPHSWATTAYGWVVRYMSKPYYDLMLTCSNCIVFLSFCWCAKHNTSNLILQSDIFNNVQKIPVRKYMPCTGLL